MIIPLIIIAVGVSIVAYAVCKHHTAPPDEVLIEHIDDYDMRLIINGVRYRGSGTVWRYEDSGKRCSTLKEYRFSDIYAKEEWRIADEKRRLK